MGVVSFSKRPCWYRAAIALLTVSLFLAVWGVIAPGWKEYQKDMQTQKGYIGLRWNCTSKLVGCTQVDLTKASDIVKGTLALSCIGLFLLGISTLNLLFRELCADERSKQKRVYDGAFVIVSGVTLFAACMIFVNDDMTVDGAHTADLGPSFILTLVASLCSSLAGLVVFCYASTGALQRHGRDPALTPGPGPGVGVGVGTDPQDEAVYTSVPAWPHPPPPSHPALPLHQLREDPYRSLSGRPAEAVLLGQGGDAYYQSSHRGGGPGPASGSMGQLPRGGSRSDTYLERYGGVRNDGFDHDRGVNYIASPRLDYY